MATDPRAVAAAMEALGCVDRPHRHHVIWEEYGGNAREVLHEPTDAGCPVAVAVVERLTPTIAARALEDAADDPSLRLQGHSGISIRGLRARAAEIRNQPKETP